ncbi:MAG: four helix bundle suffix domain-containing protein [Victivallales bacterium]|nr:four helix bundle suffix domain-containing protein [Victivallales bacterium]
MYDITFVFSRRFLSIGDRTVDQMVQAARSGKQNIVEGSADGMTSSEMEIKLLNVARASIKELREDYEDYLRARHLQMWDNTHPRYDGMLSYCRTHDRPEEYMGFVEKVSDEEIANIALTLVHLIDKMMMSYQKTLEKRFVQEGGIRERMTSARQNYRKNQAETIRQLQTENQILKAKVAELEKRLGISGSSGSSGSSGN